MADAEVGHQHRRPRAGGSTSVVATAPRSAACPDINHHAAIADGRHARPILASDHRLAELIAKAVEARLHFVKQAVPSSHGDRPAYRGRGVHGTVAKDTK